ncbi:MAG: hypothetical protein GC206_13805 [Alphaproteobacteria bacterium]|nr:hypothetical protein [Alphaproteobacteria bacterium]
MSDGSVGHNEAGASQGQRRRFYGVATLSVAAALMSATGAPDPEATAWFQSLGLDASGARAAIHATPVVLSVVVLGGVVAIGARLKRGVRHTLYGVAGAIVGFCTALCMELFAGFEGILTALVGPLDEATDIVQLGWIFAGFSIIFGAMMAAFAVFGRRAVEAIQLESCDAEALDVRRTERFGFAWASVGLVGQGLAVGGLALAIQASANPMPGFGAGLVGAALFVASSWRLWAGFDEFLRRMVIDSYAISAILFTVGAFAWAGAEAIGAAPAIDAFGALLAFLALQTVTAMVRSSAMLGGDKLGLGLVR